MRCSPISFVTFGWMWAEDNPMHHRIQLATSVNWILWLGFGQGGVYLCSLPRSNGPFDVKLTSTLFLCKNVPHCWIGHGKFLLSLILFFQPNDSLFRFHIPLDFISRAPIRPLPNSNSKPDSRPFFLIPLYQSNDGMDHTWLWNCCQSIVIFLWNLSN